MDPRRQLSVLAAAMMRDALLAGGATDVSMAPPATDALIVAFRANGAPGALAVCPLFDLAALLADGATLAAKLALEERLHAYGARDLVVWVPPGAALPADADYTAGRIADAARELDVGERGEVAFPVDVAVRKTGDAGAYMSVLGGLSQHWARFTNQVMGEYQLDASNVHRLPQDEAAVTQMVDFLVLVANGIRTPGATTTVQVDDTWRIQRLDGLIEPIVLCAPPASLLDGRAVRRLLRRSLREAAAALADRQFSGNQQFAGDQPGVRAAAMLTLANSLDRELVSTALRGLDPLLLAGWDQLTLLVDGQCKPVLGSVLGA